jgi:DNA replication protein DnaC
MICPCGEEHSGPGDWCPDCAEYEECRRAQRLHARIDGSGLPAKYHGVAIPEGPAGDAARRWADGELPGLVLTGAYGAGKTWLAGAATWRRLQRHPVHWVDTAHLMTGLRSQFGSKAKTQASAIVQGTGAIVLDDLDKPSPTEYGCEVIRAAINGRIEAGAPILVTMNRSVSEIADRYEPSIASRLAGFTVLRVQGPDRRLEQGAEQRELIAA